MLLFCDGFDDYGSLYMRYDSVVQNSGGTSAIAQNLGARTGNGCWQTYGRAGGFGPFAYVSKNLPSAETTIIVGMAILYNPGPYGPFDGNLPIIALMDGGTEQVTLAFTSSGQFKFFRASTQIGSTMTPGFTSNAYHFIEIQVTINSSTGSCQFNMDSVQYGNFTGLNTQNTSNTTMSAIRFGCNCSNIYSGGGATSLYSLSIDDVYFCDTSGSHNNAILGDHAVKTSLATGNGTLQNYTKNAAAWAASTVYWNGRMVKDSNGNLQRATSCTSDCKSGGSAPSWNVSTGGTTTDNHVTWTNLGADTAYLEINAIASMGITDRYYQHFYNIGDAILDSNGNVQYCTTAGQVSFANSGNPQPPGWNSIIGSTTSDVNGNVIWTCAGPLSTFEDTYLTDATPGDIERFTYPSITAANVAAVCVTTRIRKDDAAVRSVQGATLSGGTTGASGTDLVLTTSYQIMQGIFETDPHTGSAWTQSGVNSAEFGLKTTA